MLHRARRARVVGLISATVFAASVARAQKPKAVVATAPAGDKQPALAVGFDPSGALRAKVCTTAPCAIDSGVDLKLPEPARVLGQTARLSVMSVGKGRRVVTVEIADTAHQREWVALVAAPLDGSGQPKVLFSGWTGLIEGEFGVRRGPLVQRGGPNADGTYSVVVGEQREDLTLCGRPAIVSPQMVGPDLAFRPAKVQRLPSGERDNAREVKARRLADDAPPQGYKLLRAVAATSAVGNPAALTDGDPKTTWAENRGGEGRGEFVLMDAPSQLPISGFELVVRGIGPEPERGVAPAEFWLATRDQLIHVTMPEDAWKTPGARWEIPLETPIKSDCLALVTERAFGGSKDSRVTFAELSARTEFDATAVDGLVGALAGGGERAEAAADALRALGPAGVAPITRAFDGLDEGGRRVALAVLDQAPCEQSVGTYVKALLGPYRAHRIHANDRLRRCGAASGGALAEALTKVSVRQRPMIASELALIAPERAVKEIVPILSASDMAGRRLLRKALAQASRSPKATAEVRRWLETPTLDEVAAIDLLRALGDRAPGFQPAVGQRLAGLSKSGASFRTRFLLLGPLAAMAKSDPGARTLFARALTKDESAYVRAEAALKVPAPEAFQSELNAALRDSDVRVREAALTTLGVPAGSFASAGVADLLAKDPWPLVRSKAAGALSRFGASAEFDRALAKAIEDSSSDVRSSVLLALGERRATAHAEAVRDRLADSDEKLEVRASAAIALGLMCDAKAADVLTKYAEKLRDPAASVEARGLGPVALGALARIHPSDIKSRLEPLLDKKAPLMVRRAAEAAIAEPGSCGARTRSR